MLCKHLFVIWAYPQMKRFLNDCVTDFLLIFECMQKQKNVCIGSHHIWSHNKNKWVLDECINGWRETMMWSSHKRLKGVSFKWQNHEHKQDQKQLADTCINRCSGRCGFSQVELHSKQSKHCRGRNQTNTKTQESWWNWDEINTINTAINP